MSRVKIVATIGPKTESEDALLALREAGMGIARLNGSHNTLEWHANTIARIRKVLPDVPVLLDIPGRKIRTGILEGDLSYVQGDTLTLSTQPGHNGMPKIPLTYDNLHNDLTAGDVILADDGNLRLSVQEISGQDILCLVDSPGTLWSGTGVHVQRASVRAEFLSDRDRNLIAFACENGVDFVGMSFVESAENVQAVRDLIGDGGCRVIAKVESQGALDNLEEVVRSADAIMIDRGDLSLETKFSAVALEQKRILAEAARVACPVIVATEMLHTMIENPGPTKAEVSDITNSVLDGASALMLSGETAVGKYPIEAVKLMREVADTASNSQQDAFDLDSEQSVPKAVGDAIALLCRRLPVTKIIAITISGFAARMIASTNPKQPIIAVSNDHNAARSFNLLPGTKGIHLDIPFARTNMEHIPRCLEGLWRSNEIEDDDLILVTALSYPTKGNRMNLIETHLVSDLRENLGWVR